MRLMMVIKAKCVSDEFYLNKTCVLMVVVVSLDDK